MSHTSATAACRAIAGLKVFCIKWRIAHLTNYGSQCAIINRADVVNDGHRLKSHKLNACILVRKLYKFISIFGVQRHVCFTIYTSRS